MYIKESILNSVSRLVEANYQRWDEKLAKFEQRLPENQRGSAIVAACMLVGNAMVAVNPILSGTATNFMPLAPVNAETFAGFMYGVTSCIAYAIRTGKSPKDISLPEHQKIQKHKEEKTQLVMGVSRSIASLSWLSYGLAIQKMGPQLSGAFFLGHAVGMIMNSEQGKTLIQKKWPKMGALVYGDDSNIVNRHSQATKAETRAKIMNSLGMAGALSSVISAINTNNPNYLAIAAVGMVCMQLNATLNWRKRNVSVPAPQSPQPSS